MGNGETNTEHMHDGEQREQDISGSASASDLSSAFNRRDSSHLLQQSQRVTDGGVSNNGYIINGDAECLIARTDGEDDSPCSPSPGENAQEVGQTGPIAGAMMIVNAALGAGVLNFPIAFHEAGGVIAANVVQAIMLSFIFPALLTLAWCADWNMAKTVQEVLSFVYNKKLERICAFCIALYCLGTCTTFLIIVGDQFDRVFASVYGDYFCHTWYMDRRFTICMSAFCFILPFCYPKKIDFLKHVCSVGVLAVIYVAILIIVNYFNGSYVPGEIKTAPDNWTDTLSVVPTLSFGYQCHVSVIPIYSCYKTRNIKNFAFSAGLALTICVFMYTVAATFGYLTFGSKIQSDILSSYDANDPWVLIAIIVIGIKAFTTYPILCFCGNLALCDLWVEARAAQGVLLVDPSIKERFRLISVTFWFAITLVIAVFVPNISFVIKFLGCFASIFIFIFPGMCLLKIAEKPNGVTVLPKPRLFFQIWGGIFIVVGAFIFGCVTANAIIYNFIKTHEEADPLCLPLPA